MIKKKDFLRIKNNSSKLFEISKHIKILRYLSWDKSVRSTFLNSKSETIPKVEYPNFDSVDLRASLKKLFNLDYSRLSILIHPKSYLHAIVKFNDGIIKLIAHDTTMKIPIFNSLYSKSDKKIITNTINFKTLNNLNLSKLNSIRYPMIKLLKILPSKSSLFETVIVAANDTLVDLFLNKKINFINIQ